MELRDRQQKFFAELLRELFSTGTPSFYRIGVSNTKTVIFDIIQYLEKTKLEVITKSNIEKLFEELSFRMERDLVFNILIEKQTQNKIKELTSFKREGIMGCDEAITKKKIDVLLNTFSPLYKRIDKWYTKKAKEVLEDILLAANVKSEENFLKIRQITFSLATELIRQGFSKTYLYQTVNEIFFNELSVLSFKDKLMAFFKSVNPDEKRDYTIFFNVRIFARAKYPEKNEDQRLKVLECITSLCQSSGFSITETPPKYIKERKGCSFTKNHENTIFINVKVPDIDYGSAIYRSNEKLLGLLDIVKWEFSDAQISVHPLSYIKEKEQYHPIARQLDGHKSGSTVEFYKRFLTQMDSIGKNPNIDDDTKEKIKNSLRYFIYFQESKNIKDQFINLWIGWEQLFSLATGETSSWKNLVYFFPKIASLKVVKGLLRDLINVQISPKAKTSADKRSLKHCLAVNDDHRTRNLYSLVREKCIIDKLKTLFPEQDFSKEVNFLSLDNEKLSKAFIRGDLSKLDFKNRWDNLMNLSCLENDDLTKLKLVRVKERVVSNPVMFVREYHKKLEWDLFRIYRMRNQIMHEGARNYTDAPIELLTSMLAGYYEFLFRLIVNDFQKEGCCYETIDQLFLSYMNTYDVYVAEEKLFKKFVNLRAVVGRIVYPRLVF